MRSYLIGMLHVFHLFLGVSSGSFHAPKSLAAGGAERGLAYFRAAGVGLYRKDRQVITLAAYAH
jgi:hypothetical protein